MKLLMNFKEEVVSVSIAQTRNIDILSFSKFIRTYITEEKIKKLMFDVDELKLVKLSLTAVVKIK